MDYSTSCLKEVLIIKLLIYDFKKYWFLSLKKHL